MCREVLVSELFNFKPQSPERGKVWEKIAQALNAIKQKCTKDHDLKEKELDLRKREVELAVDRQAQAAEQQQTMMKAFMSQLQEQAQQQQSL